MAAGASAGVGAEDLELDDASMAAFPRQPAAAAERGNGQARGYLRTLLPAIYRQARAMYQVPLVEQLDEVLR